MFNLGWKAAEAMRDMPRVELLITTTSDGCEFLAFSAADTGPAVRPEMRAHLFQPFFTTNVRV